MPNFETRFQGKRHFFMLLFLLPYIFIMPQQAMTNIFSRNTTSLNGKWDVIIDLFANGKEKKVFKNEVPTADSQFLEYSFGNGLRLDVPGDWNSQLPELKYYESSIWYKRDFECKKESDKRYFIYFGAVNYLATVYLNGKLLGQHEGGFTPFQFEITEKVKQGANFVVVEVNNKRQEDQIPAMMYDWWNYGGITRDVFVVETPLVYVEDYTIRVQKSKEDKIFAEVQLAGTTISQKVTVEIPALKIKQQISTDENGKGSIELNAKPVRWSPENPKLYTVVFSTVFDTIQEQIGFRTIETKGADILLNGKKVFLSGINIHDEIPQRQGRAYSDADAALLLREAKELGCNFVRLTHYPANERMVRMAEKMGIMLWEEIPTWQKIAFQNPKVAALGEQMMREMIARDKNRCAIIIWSVANETSVSADRNKVLADYINLCRKLDNSRLVSAAFNNTTYDKQSNTVGFSDPLSDLVDVVSINKYFGWYNPWPVPSSQLRWEVCTNKPFIYSEFGAEALYSQHGSATKASSWSEEYQEKVYKDHVAMFANIPNLSGVSPWVLFDFRSPYRMHQTNQQEWNRKGIISDKGFYKKAWYVLRDYYKQKSEDTRFLDKSTLPK